MKFFIKTVTILSLYSLSLYANIATITALKGSVEVQSASSKKSATLGTELEKNDTVITADKSKAQIIFKDETIVTLGKNSHFSVAKYIYDNEHEPTVEFELLKGAMRTITGRIGKIAPQRFKVKTKTATIGIRGTNFTIIVENDGTQRAYCTYGAISVTIHGKEYIVRQGFHLLLSTTGIAKVKEFNPNELQKMKNEKFGKRIALKDRSLKNDFGNQKILDNTTDDIGDLVVKDISEDSADRVQNGFSTDHLQSSSLGNLQSSSLSNLVAGYTMSNAFYSGVSNFNDGSTGTASLNIDFGQDMASISIFDQYSNVTIFSANPTISGETVSVSQATVPFGGFQNLGTASGTFQGPTGNQVLGSFKIDDGYGTFGSTEKGTFDVTSHDTLN